MPAELSDAEVFGNKPELTDKEVFAELTDQEVGLGPGLLRRAWNKITNFTPGEISITPDLPNTIKEFREGTGVQLGESPIHIPRFGDPGTATRGISEVGSGLVEGLTTPEGAATLPLFLIPGVNTALGTLYAGAALKQGSQSLGEASVTGNRQTATEGALLAALGALPAAHPSVPLLKEAILRMRSAAEDVRLGSQLNQSAADEALARTLPQTAPTPPLADTPAPLTPAATTTTLPEAAPPIAETITGLDEEKASAMPAELGGTPGPTSAEQPHDKAGMKLRPPGSPPVKPRSSTRGEVARPWDILDDIEGHVGKININSAREVIENFAPIGRSRQLFSFSAKNNVDVALNALHHEGLHRNIETLDQFLDAMQQAARARIAWRKNFYAEEQQLDVEGKQREQFEKRAVEGDFRPEPEPEPLTLEGNVGREQLQREAAAKAERDRLAAERADLERKAKAPLTGSSADIGQGKLFVEDQDLFSGPRDTPQTRHGEILANIEQATLPRQIESSTPAPATDVPISLASIREYLSKALDIPVRIGVGRVRALGFFRPKQETIRVKALNDIPTISHEVGHYLHFILFPRAGTNPLKPKSSTFATVYDAELMALGARTSRASYSPHQVRQEGVAEFVREWLTDRTQALAKAPQFTAFFEGQLAQNFPEVWKIVSQARTTLGEYINQPALAKVKSMIDTRPEDKSVPLRKRLQNLYDDWVNELAPIERAMNYLQGLGLDPAKAKFVKDAAVNYVGGWRGKVEASLHQRQIDFDGNDVGPGLDKILGGIDSISDFRAYIVAKRALELNARGIKSGLESADARETVNLLAARFESKRLLLRQWQRNNLILLRDSGILSDTQVRTMEAANQDYVPFFRVYESVSGAAGGSGKGFVDLSTGVRRIKGSTRQIIDPLESMIKNAYLFRDLADRNRVGAAFIDALESVPGGGHIGEQIAKATKPFEVHDAELRTYLESIGMDPDTLPTDMALTIYRAGKQQSAKDGTFTVWKDGVEKRYQVDDKDLYESLKLMDSARASIVNKLPFFKAARSVTRLLRVGATLTPEFIARNPFRDQITAGVFSNYGFVPFFDGFRGLLSAVGKDHFYWDWLKSGGRYSDFIGTERSNLQQKLADVIKEPGARAMALRLVKQANVLAHLQRWSELMEQATRIAEYRKAIESGASPMEAANAAKDVSLNFSRFGFKGRLYNQISVFFNAGVQDVDKLIRSHAEHPFRTTAKAMLYITTPSLIAWYLGKDDKATQNIAEWRKSFFWNVNVGDIARLAGYKDVKDLVLSFPKPFLLGQLYGSSVERGLDYAYGRDPNAVRKWFDATLQSTPIPLRLTADGLKLSPSNILPTGFRPVIENVSNYSFFRDAKLEPSYLERLPVVERALPSTSATAQLLSRGLDTIGQAWSPVKIDNTIRGILAGLGKYGTDALDWVLMKSDLADVPVPPKRSLAELPLLRAFTQTPYAPSPNVERFYRGLELAEQRLASARLYAEQMTGADQQRYFKANAGPLAYYTTGRVMTDLRKVREEMGEISKAMRTVQLSRQISPEQKRDRLTQLNAMRDTLAEWSLKGLHPIDRAKAY